MKISKDTHIFFPVIDGEVVTDSQNKPKMYKSLETLDRFIGKFLKGKNVKVYEFVLKEEIDYES